jgi:hypothetical protein
MYIKMTKKKSKTSNSRREIGSGVAPIAQTFRPPLTATSSIQALAVSRLHHLAFRIDVTSTPLLYLCSGYRRYISLSYCTPSLNLLSVVAI